MNRAHVLNPVKPGWTLCDLDIGGAEILRGPLPFVRTSSDPEIERCPACLAAIGMSATAALSNEDVVRMAAAAINRLESKSVEPEPTKSERPAVLFSSPLYILTVTRHHYDQVVVTTVFADGALAAAAYRAAIEDCLADLLEPGEDLADLVAAQTARGCTATFDPTTERTATYFCGEENDDPVIRLTAVPRPVSSGKLKGPDR